MNGRRTLVVLLPVALCLALSGAVSALDWPVAQPVVTGTFGEYRGDHFQNGTDIGGGAQPVHPVLPGELVFRYDEGSDYSSVPRGTGSFVAIQHAQDLLTVYNHLSKGSLGAETDSVMPQDTIGTIGDTGDATGSHLHLAFYDEQTASFVNPLAILPPVADHQKPVIRRVLLSIGDTLVPTPTQSAVGVDPQPAIAAGRYQILAQLYDPRQDVAYNWPMAPYSVRVSLDGKEIRAIVFDSLRVKDGRAVLGATDLDLDAVYRPDGLMELGTADLRSGESRLDIDVRDYAGNEAAFETQITIR